MDRNVTLSYATRLAPARGASLGNGIVAALGLLSPVYSAWIFFLLLSDDNGWSRLGTAFFGFCGAIVQSLLALTLVLVYFLACRRLRRGAEISIMSIIIGSPVASGIATALAITLPNAGGC